MGTHRSLFESLAKTLVRKLLLREDPCAYDGKTSAIVEPSDSALSETCDEAEVNRRIAASRRQLAFLLDGLPSNLASMDCTALKRISSLLSAVVWAGFWKKTTVPRRARWSGW